MLSEPTIAVLFTVTMVAAGAFALPLVKGVAGVWMWTYTAAIPQAERELLRAELHSDLYEQIADARAEGYRPPEIAAQVLLRVLCGMRGDVGSVAPYFPSALAERLESGSVVLRRVSPPRPLVLAVAMLGMVNWALFSSGGDESWAEWLLMNCCLVPGIVLMWNRERRWACRAIRFGAALLVIIPVGALVWAVLKHRLYEMPTFNAFALQFAFAMLPIALGMVVSSETCRARAFRGHRWPIYASWAIIAAFAFSTAVLMGLTISLMVWAGLVLFTIGLMVLSLVFVGGSTVVCYGGLKGVAGSMRLMAAGIRRLM